MALGAWIRNTLLVFACLLIIAGLGSILFVSHDDDVKVPTAKALEDKWARQEGSALVFMNASTADLMDFMDMNEPSPEFVDAPGFELVSLAGETISLKQLRGKTVLLGFWTTW